MSSVSDLSPDSISLISSNRLPLKRGRKPSMKNSKSLKNINNNTTTISTPPEKRRVRTGCLTCRSKHKKCDETKPICKFCQSKNLNCIWPQNGMSKPSQLNETLNKILSLKDLNTLNINNINNISPTIKTNFISLPINFPSILSIIPSLQNINNFNSNINSFIFFNDKSLTSINSSFTQSLTNLLSNYFLTDPTYLLHLKNPNHLLSLSRDSKSLTFAILAISSKILQKFDINYLGENSIDFYILSVRELSKFLRNDIQLFLSNNNNNNNNNTDVNIINESIWWTIILLSYFEILSIDPSQIWSRLKNLLNFINSINIFNNNIENYKTFLNLITIPFCCNLRTINKNNDKNSNENSNENNDELNDETVDNVNNENSNDGINDNINDIEILQTICNNSLSISPNSNQISNIALQIFLINDNIKQWVDIWNLLLDWRLKLSGNEEFIQSNNSIIFAIDKDLFNSIIYHSSCYYLLLKKPINISLIFQNSNDYSSIIAFAMSQDLNNNNNYNDLINWHKIRLINILKSNLTCKSKKSIYSLFASWFAYFVLFNDNNDNDNNETSDISDIKSILRNQINWCNLDLFKWLYNEFNS